jgi:hypothetical protein
MNQLRRLHRFKAATGQYDAIRALHIAQHIANGKNLNNITVGDQSLRVELKNPKRRRVTTIRAR